MDNSNRKKRVIALGFFDGVHLGHQALLRRTMERAAEKDMIPTIFTFDRSPREFVTGQTVPLLTTVEERRRAVERLFPGMDFIVAPFDRQMMEMPWEDFILMQAQKFNGGWLVAGHDFRFGVRNMGTPELLIQKTAQLGMGCDIVPAVLEGGEVVSSTRIRRLLSEGRAEEAAKLLGRPFSVLGTARADGASADSVFGVVPVKGQLVPAPGTYAVQVETDGDKLSAAAEVAADNTVEVHFPDGNIREAAGTCRVEFLRLLS